MNRRHFLSLLSALPLLALPKWARAQPVPVQEAQVVFNAYLREIIQNAERASTPMLEINRRLIAESPRTITLPSKNPIPCPSGYFLVVAEPVDLVVDFPSDWKITFRSGWTTRCNWLGYKTTFRGVLKAVQIL